MPSSLVLSVRRRLPGLRAAAALAAVAGLTVACAGRSPQLVQTVQAQDSALECPAITSEIQSNNARIKDLSSEEGAKVAQNVVAGVAGLFIPVLWFGMDFQNAAGKEVKALEQRNQYLASVAAGRCGTTTASATPVLRTH